MKFDLVCPHFCQRDNAIASYTRGFLAEYGASQMTVFSDNCGPEATLSSTDRFIKLSGWSFSDLWAVRQSFNSSQVLIQYQPFLYSQRGGINFSIVIFALYLKIIRGKKIFIMAHELFYPLQLSPKSWVMFFSHCLMLSGLILSAKKIFFACSEQIKICNRMWPLFQSRFYHLPVYSNIVATQVSDEIIDKKYDLVFFGTFHPSKNPPEVLNLIEELHRTNQIKLKILFLGIKAESLLSLIGPERLNYISTFSHFTGFVSDSEVSSYFAQSKMMIAYFLRGVTTRRGSFIAGLDHRVGIITTLGSDSDKIFYQKSKQVIYLNDDIDIFCKELKSVLINLKNLNIQKDEELVRYFNRARIVDEFKKVVSLQ